LTFPDCPKYTLHSTQWELIADYSASCGDVDYVDFELEQQNVVLIDAAIVEEAQRMLSACEFCSDMAELTFDYILDELTGCDPRVTEYILERPARCLQCGAPITEKTLVDLA
jgi:hypothetical protein